MEEHIPIHHIDGMVSEDGEPDGCATCSEQTMSICGCKVKRWCLVIALLVLVMIGLAVPLGIYAFWFGEATSCRLTYADDALVTEAEMQNWMADERWPLSVPTHDWKRRTCVCKGFEDKDPKSLLPTDEVLVWIAPGDLASLSDEQQIDPLPAAFLNKYRGAYGEKDHVKVCLQQQYVVALWNIDPSTVNVMDGGRHCHVSNGDALSNVEQFFLGWDGALYCSSTTIELYHGEDSKNKGMGNAQSCVCFITTGSHTPSDFFSGAGDTPGYEKTQAGAVAYCCAPYSDGKNEDLDEEPGEIFDDRLQIKK